LPAVRQFAGRGVRRRRQQESGIQLRWQSTPSAPERRSITIAVKRQHRRSGPPPPSKRTSMEEEKARSPSPHGEANAAMWGGWRIACSSAIRREGCTAPPPAGDLNPNPLLVHPLRPRTPFNVVCMAQITPGVRCHLPHSKKREWGRRRRPGSGGNPAFVHSCPIR